MVRNLSLEMSWAMALHESHQRCDAKRPACSRCSSGPCVAECVYEQIYPRRSVANGSRSGAVEVGTSAVNRQDYYGLQGELFRSGLWRLILINDSKLSSASDSPLSYRGYPTTRAICPATQSSRPWTLEFRPCIYSAIPQSHGSFDSRTIQSQYASHPQRVCQFANTAL